MKYYLPVIRYDGEKTLSLADEIDKLVPVFSNVYPMPGKTRASCIDRIKERTEGREWCVAMHCRNNLLRDVMSRDEEQSAELLAMYLTGELVDTCSADFSDRGPMSYGAIAKALGITEERVKQIENEAIREIRLSKAILKTDPTKAQRATLNETQTKTSTSEKRRDTINKREKARRLRSFLKSAGQVECFGDPDDAD